MASVMSIPTTLLIPAAPPFLAPMAANQNMMIRSASSCESAFVLISGSTVVTEVDAAAAVALESVSTEEREYSHR